MVPARMARPARRVAAWLLLALAGTPLPALSSDGAPAGPPAYAWVDLRDCKSPKIVPPRLPRETELVYNVQRRFLDLDRNGRCVVLDVWLERLASIPDSVSRNFEHRLFRFDGKQWAQFIVPELPYYPYALQVANHATVFVLAAIDDDVGDAIVLGGAPPSVYQAASGQQGLFGADGTSLTPYGGDPRPIFGALAEQLSRRLASGQLVKEELLTVPPADRPAIEQRRIDMLQKAAR